MEPAAAGAVFTAMTASVQDLLDRNKLLINEINANHESKTPDGLSRNVVLIRELNANIAKVAELYHGLSAGFAGTAGNTTTAHAGAHAGAGGA